MDKYNLFKSDTSETNYWDRVFGAFFKGYVGYEVASKEDDDLYGVDVWVKRKRNSDQYAKIRIGVQLKTSRDLWVSIHYEMRCKSGWNKQIGINIYVGSTKVDYLFYAYPYNGLVCAIDQQGLIDFWDVYHDQLVDYRLVEQSHGGECQKYYFQIDVNQFAVMCKSIEANLHWKYVN